MGLLIAAGLVDSRKDGRWVYYRLKNDRTSFEPVLEWIKREFARDRSLQNDRKLLLEITAMEPEELCRKQRGEACCPKQSDLTE